MTNARCLTEGVDLPAIDCVVFTDPKKSKVDIVQAAGRALRLSPGKKFGYILIPLIIPENENATEAAKDTAFEEIVATIRALATQDSRIIEYLRAVSSGTIPKGGSPVDGITKINVLTKVNEKEFNKSIQLKVWDRIAFGNWRPYEEAKKYAQSLKLKSGDEWNLHIKSNYFPKDIRKSPRLYKEFKSFADFFGTYHYRGNFVPFNLAKKYAQSLKLKRQNQWYEHIKSNLFIRDNRIPMSPQSTYKKDWVSWGDFLGTNFISSTIKHKNYYSYEETKKFIRNNLTNITSENKWKLYIKTNPYNKFLPLDPYKTYKNNGWVDWFDFLGKEK
jgi:hypothetical protein